MNFWKYLPPVVKNILILNVILLLATIVFDGFNINLYSILGLHYWQSDKFNVLQLISYMFMHGGTNMHGQVDITAGLTHIFFNMFALVMFGSLLERTFGTRRFLLYYIVTGIGAGIVQQIFWTVDFGSFVSALNGAINSGSVQDLWANHSAFIYKMIKPEFHNELPNLLNTPLLIDLKENFVDAHITVGASGSVFGILLAFGWLFPQAELYMFFIPIPIKARLAVTIYAVAELFLGVANFSFDNIAHFAHLGGMLFGAILIWIWQRKRFKI
ncbi:MAG: rhomboid family intramembrane serine protease [Paludibacter sp.]|jgi:membrane associated rhomboid family serine protease|nr:rhomboid family intramembrane serine protease [Paludibacter sp.]